MRTIEQGLLAFKDKLAVKVLSWSSGPWQGVLLIKKGSMNTNPNSRAESSAKMHKQNKIDRAVKWTQCTENQLQNGCPDVWMLRWRDKAGVSQGYSKEWIECDTDRLQQWQTPNLRVSTV